MHVPNSAFGLLDNVFNKLFPLIDEELDYWKKRAQAIPDEELRKQALASIHSKTFHCQGGGVFALLAGRHCKEAIRFIVAYQTISDYLDNLCDRSTSLDPKDFRMLHEAMKDALIPGAPVKNYYTYREEQEDGGYLTELVLTCQGVLDNAEAYGLCRDYCLMLEGLYADLQVHKHVKMDERVPRLVKWYLENREKALGLSWYEFAAVSGSTIGIFCLVSYTLSGKLTKTLAEKIIYSYFPAVQGLHILLDYYIDQEEDEKEGDLNFCSFYRDDVQLVERIQYFLLMAEERLQVLPDPEFHQFIPKGLVALYLSDGKVKSLKNGSRVRRTLLKTSGIRGAFLHYNIRIYNRVAK
ncbi:tetraprenyl-beta-curcumene synthase family protein [Oceanobacillus luteolus]|uniref:Tetraprenyl-beta-curcumene synthase family protein n=2 Tax=Oceanobacillus luteolus TaxID=1274358 RepID=A0ABW4HV18_9BACI